MAERGVDLVLQSQYTGHAAGTPFEAIAGGRLQSNYYPGLALYNWTTGALQPRSVVNQIIVAQLEVGSDVVIGSSSSTASVYALELASSARTRKALLVSKRATAQEVSVASVLGGATSATAWIVDETYQTERSPRVVRNAEGSLKLSGFATAVLVQS